MSTATPIHLNNWINFTTTIDAPQVRAEFLNLYNVVNGNISTENLSSGAVTTSKINDNAVTDAKIVSVSASKVTGQFNVAQLPSSVVYSTGSNLTGSLTYTGTDPVVKSYATGDVTLLEVGVGADKVSLTFNSTGNALVLKKGSTILLTITGEGELVPKAFRVPVIASAP